MFGMTRLLALLGCVALATAHSQIIYPGERGNNLHTNGTLPQLDPTTIGVDKDANGSWAFPYGMQWIYPCGGLPLSRNRTVWPYTGGAISVQPGWFPGHSKALIYINMGITARDEAAPPNMSHVLVPPFQLLGPTNQEYAGQFCLPQVPMPVNISLSIGDNVTIQVIEAAQHGAALYNCVDVTLVDPKDAHPVTPQNCYNSSDLGFELLFTSAALTNDAVSLFRGPSLVPLFVAALVTGATALL